jgi:hypothetical protein
MCDTKQERRKQGIHSNFIGNTDIYGNQNTDDRTVFNLIFNLWKCETQ